MIAAVFDAAGLDPTVINGGIINSYGTNARLGSGEWMVVEADESDGTFVKLPATVAVVTNIDPEHLDYFGDYESLKRAFVDFVENIPFYGFCALCLDHPEVQAMIQRVRFGIHPEAEKAGYDKMTSILDLHLKDGRTISGRADFATDSPSDPMSFDEVAAKFQASARFARWPEAKADALVEGVRRLEEIPDVRTITALLSA